MEGRMKTNSAFYALFLVGILGAIAILPKNQTMVQ